MTYQAIIFDFDGVIFDSEPLHWQAYHTVLAEFNVHLPKQEYFEYYVGSSDREMVPAILKNNNRQFSEKEVTALINAKANTYKQIIASHDELATPYYLPEFIKSCATHFKNLAICSGSSQEEIRSALAKLQEGALTNYFKHIISCEYISRGKPSPEGYLLAAKYLQVAPSTCLAIEDTPKGIKAAKAAGMDVIALTTTHDKAILSEATFIAENFVEIARWLATAGLKVNHPI